MRIRIFCGFLFALLFPSGLLAQITGTVYVLENGTKTTLPGANVFWENTSSGTITAADGTFTIDPSESSNTLVASYLGMQPVRKILISRKGEVEFVLQPAAESLAGTEIVAERDATSLNPLSAGLSFNIGQKELRKAACCNLSESFETNASVDVSFSDAVTGQKQIEMLGLAGKYALIQRENIPFGRGLNAPTAMAYIPGPFVESINLTKGLSSVLNGYESITGQINVEYFKPETSPRLLLNAYGDQNGRTELNAIGSLQAGQHVGTSLLLHGSMNPMAFDGNNDGFADMPTGEQINLFNRWHFHSDNGWEGQVGLSVISDNREGGQMDFVTDSESKNTAWGFTSEDQRYEFYGKAGYVFPETVRRSIGFIVSGSYLNKEAKYGQRHYKGNQSSLYFNTIFQDMIGNTNHKYSAGISFQADDVSEKLIAAADEHLYRGGQEEIVPGAFVEYTYEPSENLTLVAGARADYNSYYQQLYATPRVHLRYKPWQLTTFRLAAGRGQRTPNVMAENLSLLASSRALHFEGLTPTPEVAWNFGYSLNQKVPVGEKVVDFTADVFYTLFENKLVTDLDYSVQDAYFLTSDNNRSLSVLAQAEFAPVENLDFRLAYKYLKSEENYLNGVALVYLIPTHRAMANVAYSIGESWKFDFTTNWFGAKRLPDTSPSPAEYQRPAQSPDFFTLNTQVNYTFKNGIEIFAGAENLLDFKQENPIISAENPQGPWFDSNLVWGPITGRNIYVGLYYKLFRQ